MGQRTVSDMPEITLRPTPMSGATIAIAGSAAARISLAAANRRGRPIRSLAVESATSAACQGHSRSTVVALLVERPANFRFPLYRRARRTEQDLRALMSPEQSPNRTSSPCADFGSQISKRELEVVKLVCTGMTNREIANKLFIAERTAEGHVERIRNKLGVRSRTEVAIWAAKHGLD